MPKVNHSVWLLFVILASSPCTSQVENTAFADARTNKVKKLVVDEMDIGQKPESECKIHITEHMKWYFQRQLEFKKPHFVQFKIRQINNLRNSSTNDVFKPFFWSWTFADSSEPYPFISWKLDYGLLSFHLLDAKTILVKDVYLNVSDSCVMTYGTDETTKMIVKAMIPLINVSNSDYPTYPISYFCYYYISKNFSDLHYQASLYFIFPITSIGFKCSVVFWEYAEKTYNVSKQTYATHLSGFHKWREMSLFPFFVGTVILLFFPVVLFTIAAWMSEDEKINLEIHQHELLGVSVETETADNDNDDVWLYSDGNSPLGLSNVLSFRACGLQKRFPVFTSRLRRFLFVLAAPMFLYLQSAMYLQGMGVWDDGDKVTIKDLVAVGAPMGFLSIFGDEKERLKVFVPLLGGPVGVVTLYYTIGILFIALPKSFKRVIEDGIPRISTSCISPLFYDFSKIISLSMVNIKPHQLTAGYTKASTILKCRFYCLFTVTFWKSVWDIQKSRTAFGSSLSPICKCLFGFVFLPVYVLLCLTEILFCIVYYGLPLFGFIVIIVNGATRSVGYLGQQSRFLRFRITHIFVFCLFIVFAYIISLMFIQSFAFIIQVLTYTLVAVIVYPSVSFGYLYFVFFLLYYFIKLIRNFGDKYEELLTTAVELSRHLQEDINFVYSNDGQLNIVNMNVESVKDIRINGKALDVSLNILQSLKNNRLMKVKRKNDAYGIPRGLFDTLVKRHKPVHVQLLLLCFKAILLIVFVAIISDVCANYVTGLTSDISEVMHVIFVVAIGAVPSLAEAVLSHPSSGPVREIEDRRIQGSIIEYWNNIKQ